MPGLAEPGLAEPGLAMPGLAVLGHLEQHWVRWAVPAAGGCHHRDPLYEAVRDGTDWGTAGCGRAWGAGSMPGAVLARALSPFIVSFDNYRGRSLMGRAVGAVF